MTPEDEAYFEDMFSLFRTSGWKRLMTEMQETSQSLNNLAAIKDGDTFLKTKGMDSVVNDILSLETRTHAAHDEASAPQFMEDEDE